MAFGIPGVHCHVGVATRDLGDAMTSVGEAFGLTWAEPIDGSTAPAMSNGAGQPARGLRRAVHSMGGPMRIELLEGQPGSVWATDQPAVLHHVAYWIDDIAGTAASLVADGWSVELTITGPDAAPSGFAYLTKPGHARVELTDAARRDETLALLGWAEWRGRLR